jgi:hypothetical protein
MWLSGIEHFVTACIFHPCKQIWYCTSKYLVTGTRKSFIKFREHFLHFFTFKLKSAGINLFRSVMWFSFIILYEG